MAFLSNLTDGQLAEYMGTFATTHEARQLRRLMLEAGHQDTRAVPAEEWQRLIDRAARLADLTDPDPRDYDDA